MRDAFIDADPIRAATFARHVEIHDTLGSTNDRATELARDVGIELPALVVARQQTAGRGRGQNIWWSSDGALTFSLLIEPANMGIRTMNWPQLSLTTAVAICDALAQELRNSEQRAGASPLPTGLEDEPARLNQERRLGIKWPNDVMLDGSKICGILIESPGGAAPAKDRLIIGIGINLNNSWRSAPHDAGPNGTSLRDSTGELHSAQRVLMDVLHAIHERIRQLASNEPQLASAWQQLCWLTEQGVEAHSSGRWISGVCTGIDTDGALVIDNVFGTHRVNSGSVRAL